MTQGTWRIDRVTRLDGDTSLPYLITIASGERIFQLRAKETWPAPEKSLFAMRAVGHREDETLTLVETFPLLQLSAVHGNPTPRGKRTSTINVAIDRPRKKHCSVLVMQEIKPDGSKKEVIFIRTEKSAKAHRSRTYLQPTSLRNIAEIVIDSRERYPWSFAATTVTKAPLRSGDYALRIDEAIVAVVERKTRENMLANIATLETYHAHLHELATYPAAALVIEAQYRDFLDPNKTKPMAASRCGRALADIAAKHPNLQIIFAGNRKDANVWAAHFFEACSALHATSPQQALSLHNPPLPAAFVAPERVNTGGIDAEVRHAIMTALPPAFPLKVLVLQFPDIPQKRLSDCLKALRNEGKLTTRGAGRGTQWVRVQLVSAPRRSGTPQSAVPQE